MADNQLDILENRLEALEKRVFGGCDKDALYPKGMTPFQCTDTLGNVHAKLGQAVTGKKKINKIFDRLQEVQSYLDPATADEMTLSDAAKTEIILAEEDFLQQQAARLETLTQLQDTLDSEHLRDVPTRAGKLQDLSQLQLKQLDQAGEVTDEVRELLASYNSTINLLSKQFIQWDKTLTAIEKARQPKEVLD